MYFFDFVTLFVFQAIFLSLTWSLPPRQQKPFRSDYEYNRRTDSFYKLHTKAKSSWGAARICHIEGTTLMMATSPEDIKQLHGMAKKYPSLTEFVWVGSDAEDSSDEHPLINLSEENDYDSFYGECNVLSQSGEKDKFRCYQNLPFMCKVQAKDAPYDSRCDVYANDYVLNSTVGSCYRTPSLALTWDEAEADCRAQNAHLVILNSETERNVVLDYVRATPYETDAKHPWYLFTGFRATRPVGNETVVFKSIFNQTLQEAGFAEWSPYEPNNVKNNEYCLTLFKNDGKLNDVNCAENFPYICEKENIILL